MLLSLRDVVGIALTPEHVTGVRVSRGWRRRVVDQRHAACDGAENEPPWKRAVSALQMLLPALAREPAKASVVLSNRFVRYVVVPAHDQLTGLQEEEAFARHCFREVYGDAAQTWEVRVSPAAVGQPAIASAIDRELLSAVRELFTGTALRLWSIQPHLMAAYNRSRRKLRGRACLFLLAEERFYTCMALVRGSCRAVHSGVFDGALSQHLPVILDREYLWSGMEKRPTVLVCAPEHASVRLTAATAWGGNGLQFDDTAGIASALAPVYRTALTVT